MALYKLGNKDLVSIKELSLPLEKDIQTLVENNISQLFNLTFIKTEFQLNNLRIDTLAFDEETRSFVIIEYKKGKSFSVIDQGFAYLSLMLNNKADFILEYNETQSKAIRKDEIDWSQTRVVFIAQSFTTHQQNAINFKNLPIELWEIKKYEGDLISLNQIQADDTSDSIETISKDPEVKRISQEVVTYTIDHHIRSNWDNTREVYQQFIEALSSRFSELKEKVSKSYIGYQINGWNVISIKPYKVGLTVMLNRHRPEDLKDPDKKVRYWEHSLERYNQSISLFLIESTDDIDYAMYLIKQVYDNFDKNSKYKGRE